MSRSLYGIVFACMVMASTVAAHDRPVVGWVERVQIGAAGGLALKAKIDTGAKTSSLSVTQMQRFSRDGRPWVRFDIDGGEGARRTMEKPVLRTVRIKRHGRAAKSRPVVVIGLCLGSVFRNAQVDLADRANFIYPLLVGRRFLAGHFLVDPGAAFLVHSHCANPAPAPA